MINIKDKRIIEEDLKPMLIHMKIEDEIYVELVVTKSDIYSGTIQKKLSEYIKTEEFKNRDCDDILVEYLIEEGLVVDYLENEYTTFDTNNI